MKTRTRNTPRTSDYRRLELYGTRLPSSPAENDHPEIRVFPDRPSDAIVQRYKDLLERETNPAILYKAYDWMHRHFPAEATLPAEIRNAIRRDRAANRPTAQHTPGTPVREVDLSGCERCGSSLHDRCTAARRDLQPLSEEEILRRFDTRR